MSIKQLVYVAAFLCFVLAAFGATPLVVWPDAGFALLTLSLLIRG